MAEYTAIAEQTVISGQPVVFTESPIPCTRGLIRHEDGTGLFTLSGAVPASEYQNRCCCQGEPTADYLVTFHANIAIPEGGTVGPIQLTIAMDGTPIPASTMIVTPTAVEAYFNVGTAKNVRAFPGCCRNLSIVNTSADQAALLVSNAILNITRPDLIMTL